MSELPRAADVVIVGGGIAGVSLAWHLAPELDVVVIEQGLQPCAEASAQNAAILRRLVPDARERGWACRTWDRLHDEALTDWFDAPPFRRTGALIAFTAEHESADDRLVAAAADLRARGVRVDRLDGDDLSAYAPVFRGAQLSHGYWLPDEGTCDPHAMGAGFARGAVRRGASIHCDTRVKCVRRDGGRVIGVESDRGRVDAGCVVLATAAWTPGFVRELEIERPFRPLARHLLFSDAHPLATPDHPWCWLEDAAFYLRAETGGWLCSPCDEAEVEPPIGPGSRREPQPLGRALALDKIERHLPALASVRLSHGWVGLRTFTQTREPRIGFDADVAGLFWMTGFGGSGISTAFGMGEDAAACLTAAPAAHPIDECSADA